MTRAKSIETEQEYEVALARLYELFNAEPGTPEGDEFEVLANLVEAYETIHYPIPEPTPAGIVQGRLDALGLTEDDLVPCLGSREMVDEILAGQRDITPEMAESLHQFLGIPVEDLLPEATPSHG